MNMGGITYESFPDGSTLTTDDMTGISTQVTPDGGVNIIDTASGTITGYYPPNSGAGSTIQAVSSQAQVSGDSSNWLSTLTQALPSISAFLNAQQLANVNVQRARQGLPPLNTAAYGPQVGVSMAPQTQQFLMIGLLAVAALVMLSKRKS